MLHVSSRQEARYISYWHGVDPKGMGKCVSPVALPFATET